MATSSGAGNNPKWKRCQSTRLINTWGFIMRLWDLLQKKYCVFLISAFIFVLCNFFYWEKIRLHLNVLLADLTNSTCVKLIWQSDLWGVWVKHVQPKVSWHNILLHKTINYKYSDWQMRMLFMSWIICIALLPHLNFLKAHNSAYAPPHVIDQSGKIGTIRLPKECINIGEGFIQI
jgi:hypothetical protein